MTGWYLHETCTACLRMVKSHTGIAGLDRCIEMSARERECRYIGKDGKKGRGRECICQTRESGSVREDEVAGLVAGWHVSGNAWTAYTSCARAYHSCEEIFRVYINEF